MHRRALLTGLGAAAVGAVAGLPVHAAPALAGAPVPPTTGAPNAAAMPAIRRREEWADAPPTGPLQVEEDVRVVLVHHTASGNGYGADAVPGILRGIRSFHTGPEKGWPDIAYNFLVDRFGVIWEGRQGSIDQVVRGDATGGSQGFAVLCCVLGDLRTTPPSPATRQALVDLAAWQCGLHDIDPQGTTSFTSRGSNRHPAGALVTTATITGHRTMSQTACPGDAGMALVQELPTLVAAARPAGPQHYRRA